MQIHLPNFTFLLQSPLAFKTQRYLKKMLLKKSNTRRFPPAKL